MCEQKGEEAREQSRWTRGREQSKSEEGEQGADDT